MEEEFHCLCHQSWLNKANPRLQPAFIAVQDLGMPVGVSCTLLSRQRMPGLGGGCCLLWQIQRLQTPGGAGPGYTKGLWCRAGTVRMLDYAQQSLGSSHEPGSCSSAPSHAMASQLICPKHPQSYNSAVVLFLPIHTITITSAFLVTLPALPCSPCPPFHGLACSLSFLLCFASLGDFKWLSYIPLSILNQQAGSF